jgi:hypothetical protein
VNQMDGLAVGMIAIGGFTAWSGISNQSLTVTLKALLGGKTPAPGPAASLGFSASYVPPASAAQSGTGQQEITATTPGSGNATQNQTLGKLMAGGYGWYPGAQWTALNDVVMKESGWLANARNPSGAYGIAQALKHGTSATVGANGTNAYGPDNGISVATAKAANNGSAQAQIAWMLAYIHGTYGTPAKAWAHEQSAGSY